MFESIKTMILFHLLSLNWDLSDFTFKSGSPLSSIHTSVYFILALSPASRERQGALERVSQQPGATGRVTPLMIQWFNAGPPEKDKQSFTLDSTQFSLYRTCMSLDCGQKYLGGSRTNKGRTHNLSQKGSGPLRVKPLSTSSLIKATK